MAYDSVFKAGLFAGQTIMVTGGGSGIGRCTAHELAALGAHVVLVGRKLEKLENTCAEIIHGLHQFFARIHDEWPVLRNGFIQGLPRDQQSACACLSAKHHTVPAPA